MSSQAPVTVLGLGAMGRALALAFLAAGQPTTVWNRTAAKAQDLTAHGAVAAGSVAEAVTANQIVVVCLLDYGTVRETLEPVAAELRGRTVVNLTNGTPAQADEMAAWITGLGAEYLDGGIMAIPATVATPEAFVLYSGPESVFQEHRAALEAPAAAKYLGEDFGLASLYDLALLSGHMQMLDGFLHGAAMATSREGGTATGYAELLVSWLKSMIAVIPAIAADIDADRKSGTPPQIAQGLDVQLAGVGNILTASREAGVDTAPLDPYMAGVEGLAAAGQDLWSGPARVRQLKGE
ncbi:NAD(P)-binding domain-containing protein [Streptoalloteichus hindustanus]|uniref:NAD binding domain of 6-phosphogluconate dehydrogenase n=1 Tax=Streptoalloteichus hindustanus TaxID=2017 RepID=A0A1M5DQU4_STRHI|nr:NAD(P)-binding domain-containing protein [Streptoalloteichus hindustanus]SHF69221.1 NAD binding domain of 6-phosphogluconate dehydrogenase [Streptoalloteichus hindustanus]